MTCCHYVIFWIYSDILIKFISNLKCPGVLKARIDEELKAKCQNKSRKLRNDSMKSQLKIETSEKDTRTRNRQSATEQFARWTQLLVVARDDFYSLGGKTFTVESWDLLVGRQKTLIVASWELLARRPSTLVGRAMTSSR